MSTRCSIIVRSNQDAYYLSGGSPRGPRTEKGINGRECHQFYHHHDGYLSGVGEEIFEFFRLGIRNDSLSLRELPGSYEPEDFGSIHGDWEYLYIVECKGDAIEFYVSRQPRLVKFFKDRNESENSGEEDLDTMIQASDNFRLYASLSLHDSKYEFDFLKRPLKYVEGVYLDTRE